MARPLNILPSPPFFGRLETPADDGFVRHGKLLISGWLTHANRPILGLTARVNGVPSDTKLTYGLQRRDVHHEFPDHPNSGYSHFLGLIDFPSTAANPAIILIFADVGDDIAPLVFAQRFLPWNRSVAASSQKRLSFSGNLWCAAALVHAHWRHSKGKTNRADLSALLKIPPAALVARRTAASAPFAESIPLSLFVSSLEDHELSKPDDAKTPLSPSPSGLNLLFVLHCDFSCASALHVLALTGELSRLGHACIAAVPEGLETLTDHEPVACRGILHADIPQGIIFPNGKGPDVIHAWTARERVRRPTELALKKHPRAILIVHLEDNEESLLSAVAPSPIESLVALTETEFDRIVSQDVWHPREGPRFLAKAAGATLIIATLAALVPKHIHTCVITPSVDRRYFHPQSPFKGVRHLIADENETILFYNGNVHASNAIEVRELYSAILALNHKGVPTRLIRTGRNEIDFLGELAAEVAPFVHDLGKIRHHRHLAPLMALADIFVQPGGNNEFNAFRFPSKLPEFFSFGRPVIIPRTNLGLMVRHGVDAFVLEKAHSAEIAGAVRLLRSDTQLYRRLSEGATAFSERYFSWRRSAESLAAFYETLVSKKQRSLDEYAG